MKKNFIPNIFLKLINLTILFLFSVFFLSCQKEMFGYVEVSGRILDFYTKDPLKINVRLMGDDATSGKQQTNGSIILAKGVTKNDGTFTLHSKPTKRHNYYISIDQGGFNKIDVQKNRTTQLGDFFGGSHTVYCNVNIISISDSTIHLPKTNSAKDFYTFTKGTHTNVLLQTTFNSVTFTGITDLKFPISYQAFSEYGIYGVYRYLSIPITSLSDTLETTIYF